MYSRRLFWEGSSEGKFVWTKHLSRIPHIRNILHVNLCLEMNKNKYHMRQKAHIEMEFSPAARTGQRLEFPRRSWKTGAKLRAKQKYKQINRCRVTHEYGRSERVMGLDLFTRRVMWASCTRTELNLMINKIVPKQKYYPIYVRSDGTCFDRKLSWSRYLETMWVAANNMLILVQVQLLHWFEFFITTSAAGYNLNIH